MEWELGFKDFFRLGPEKLFRVLRYKIVGPVEVSCRTIDIFKRILDSCSEDDFVVHLVQIPIHQKYALSRIICTSTKIRRSLTEACTPLGERISNSLIRVATSRIFSRPEQSLLEIPVNSIDSYNRQLGKPQVGKFGMGFFSILYWLIGHPDNQLSVTSKYVVDDTTVGYDFNIQWTDRGFNYTITTDEIPLDSVKYIPTTGTVVILTTKAEMNISLLHRLSDVDGVIIKYMNIQLNKERSGPLITIDKKFSSTNNMLVFRDSAEGIPLTTVYNSLLIPSSSTKTIRQSSAKEYVSKTRVETDSFNDFTVLFITVNNIVVVEVTIRSSNRNFDNNYIISMPPNTSLPVARDDIILEKGSPFTDIFERELLKLVMITISEIRNLVDLYGLMDKYCQWSNQGGLNEAFQRVKDKVLSLDNYYVPDTVLYRNLINIIPPAERHRWIIYPDPDLLRLEEQILPFTTRTDIFQHKSVIITENLGCNYSTGNLNRVVFIDRKFFESHPVSTIISSCTVFLPTPYQPSIIPELTSLQQNLGATIRAKFENFPYSMPLVMTILERMCHNFRSLSPTDEELKKFYLLYNGKLSKINFSFAYGASPQILMASPSGFGESLLGWPYSYSTNNDPLALQLSKQIMYWTVTKMKETNIGPYFIIPLDMTITGKDPNISKIMKFLYDSHLPIPELIVAHVCLNHLICSGKYRDNVLPFLIHQIRSRCSLHDLEVMVLSSLFSLIDHDNIMNKVVIPVLTALNIFTSKFKSAVFKPIVGDYQFSAKALLKYSFEHELHDDWYGKIPPDFRETDLNLQVVEIAVNEGTTKDYITSSITEIVQNSVDAIRTTGSDKGIDINIASNGIIITDYVGIPISALPALMIPFLSTKTADNKNVTGEMGSGFFTTYRYPWCKFINIESVYDKKMFTMTGTPVILDQRVVDINYQLTISQSSLANQTTIGIYLEGLSDEIMAETLATAKIFVLNRLSTMKIPIRLNGDNINTKLQQVYQCDVATFYVQDSLPSIVMTNGIPFSDIQALFIQFPHIYEDFKADTTIGVVIDLNKEYYTPVQSRNRLSIEPNKSQHILQAILKGLYVCLLHKYSDEKIQYPDRMISNTTSTAPIDQLLLSACKMGHPSKNYMSYLSIFKLPEELPILEIINEIIRKKPTDQSQCNSFITDMLEYRDLQYRDVLIKTVTKWFSNKSYQKTSHDIKIHDKIVKSSGPRKENVGMPFAILQPFVNIYWRMGRQLFPDLFPVAVPTIYAGQMAGLQGFYQDGKIYLNIDLYPVGILNVEIEKIRRLPSTEAILACRTNDYTRKIFSVGQPTNALIHELLHAVKSEKHADSPHGSQMFLGSEHTFDQMAIAIYVKFLDQGLMQEFLKNE